MIENTLKFLTSNATAIQSLTSIVMMLIALFAYIAGKRYFSGQKSYTYSIERQREPVSQIRYLISVLIEIKLILSKHDKYEPEQVLIEVEDLNSELTEASRKALYIKELAAIREKYFEWHFDNFENAEDNHFLVLEKKLKNKIVKAIINELDRIIEDFEILLNTNFPK